MATLTCGNGAFNPVTSTDNWTLDSQSAGVFGQVVAIGWGGRLTTSTAYRTRWHRPVTSSQSTFTTLSPAFHNPNYTSFGARVGTFASAGTLQTDPSGNLFAQDWNAQGGVGLIVMPLANPWWLINGVGQGQIGCRNVQGTDSSGSSYELTYNEP